MGRARSAPGFAVRSALTFALLGTAWVLFSDRAVEIVVPDQWQQLAQSLKGTVFILGSSLFIFLTVRSSGRDRARAVLAEHETWVRARQQTAVAELGELALGVGEDLDTLFEASVRAVARTLGVGFSKVLQLSPDGSSFRLVAGAGWAPGVVGTAIVPAEVNSQAGYTLASRSPVVVEDLASETRFSGPALLVDHKIVAGMSAPIGDHEDPWGVLGAHSAERRHFSEDDVAFLTGVANILASAIQRVQAESALRETEARYRTLVERTPGVEYIAEPGETGAWYYVSPQVEALLGYPSSHWVADSHLWFHHVHEEDRARVIAAEERSGEIGERFVDEYRMIAADGRMLWVRDEAEVVRRDPDGPILWGILYDITERKQADAEIRRFAERLEAVHDLDRAMLNAASTDDLLGVALDRLRRLVPCDRVAVRLLDGDEGAVRVALAWQRDGVDLQIADQLAVLDTQSMALLQRELFVLQDMEDFSEIPSLLQPLAQAGFRSGIGATLVAEGRSFGYLIVMSRTPSGFDEGHGEIVRELAAELAIGLRQASLREALSVRAEELQGLADQRQALLGQIVAAQEQERRRVANELHDGLGQTLTAISLRTGAMELGATSEMKTDLIKLRELASAAVAESRRIVWGLRPPELEELGFVEVLRRGAVDLGSARGVEVDVRVGPEGVFLASEEEPMVLLILQEALNNAIKHAGARSICIDIGSEGNAFVATVADDGAGFDATGVNWGIGLISMRERADVLGGTLEIVSRPEGGTIVRLRLADSRLVGTPAREA